MEIKVPANSSTEGIYRAFINVAQQIMQDIRQRTTEYLKAQYSEFEAGAEKVTDGTYYLTFTANNQQLTIAYDMKAKKFIEEAGNEKKQTA